MPENLRVALLGGGKMALQHAAAIRQCRNVRLVAVVDPAVPPVELAARFGAEVTPFADAQEMLAAVRPDVVHVVTPPATHALLARTCLEAGASVYVEKPFALTIGEADSVLKIADSRRLRVCAAHQVLFQDAGRAYQRHLPMIGEIVHVESFFSFRPVRRHAGGGGLSTPVSQLIDILPHPVYLLLDALPAEGGARAEITALDVSIDGEVRAVIRRGRAFGLLVVSLNARPVESWLRVMGMNGMVEADFVLGNVIRHPGPGASAPSVVLKPFSRAWQTGWGSLKAVLKLVFRRHKSYPGLAELLDLFYGSVREGTTPPVSPAEIIETVRICETVSERLHALERADEEQAVAELRANEASLTPINDRGIVLLTGGTGMLGRSTAKLLRAAGWRVRVPVRRALSPRHQLPGIEYVMTDLARDVPDSLLAGVETVLHLAAETAGNKADHERNTIQATRNLIDAMLRTGTRRLVNIGSVAVLKPSRFGRSLTEDSPVDYDNMKRGPYVWAKAESERMAMEAARAGGIDVRTVRLGPLVDFDEFAAPGRLGREVARLFVAMGRPTSRLGVCNVADAAAVLRGYADAFDTFPAIVNLLQVPAPTRQQLADRLRRARPDLRVMWLPFWILRILSTTFSLLQRLLRPSSSPLDLYAAFAAESYRNEVAGRVFAAVKAGGNGVSAANDSTSAPETGPERH